MENKIMAKPTITRERLEQLADNNTICKVSWDERIELAQIVLAAMDSEPVAEVVSIYGDPEAFGEREIRPLVGIQQMPYGTNLYRHAQQPVVPDEITSASAPEVFEIAAEAERLGLRGTYASYAVGWNACRAAMLAAAPQSPGSEPTTVPGKWIPVSEQMPEVGDIVLTAMEGVVNVGEMECSAANCRFFTSVISGRELPATYWMPLPAPPKEVK
ncbi:TPA: DUF551 domain-containing protein [Klebsiella pneumoniae]